MQIIPTASAAAVVRDDNDCLANQFCRVNLVRVRHAGQAPFAMVASGIILVVMLRPLFAAKGCVVDACRRQTVAQGHALIINVKFKTAQSAKTLGWCSIVLPVYANNVHKIINALPKKIVFESETRIFCGGCSSNDDCNPEVTPVCNGAGNDLDATFAENKCRICERDAECPDDLVCVDGGACRM